MKKPNNNKLLWPIKNSSFKPSFFCYLLLCLFGMEGSSKPYQTNNVRQNNDAKRVNKKTNDRNSIVKPSVQNSESEVKQVTPTSDDFPSLQSASKIPGIIIYKVCFTIAIVREPQIRPNAPKKT
jgi:hypothetical protein